MNIGLFGGSFDPIHRGHIALARAAAERYGLHRVLFVPANVPPHKQKQPLAPFIQRYTMIVLATQDEKKLVPSLLEAPEAEASSATSEAVVKTKTTRHSGSRPRSLRSASTDGESGIRPNYSIDTIRRLKQRLKKSDRLFFLMGIDAFKEIATWHEARALLGECDFVVASRPGYSLKDVAESLPEGLRPPAAVTQPFQKQPATGDLILPGLSLHLLGGVEKDVSATAIRTAAAQGKPLGRWLDARVVEYIRKTGLYRSERESM